MRMRTGKWAGLVAMLFGILTAGATLIGTSPASAFGALAVGETDGYGFSFNYPNESEARARAQKECGGSCQIVIVFQNTCSSFAADRGSSIYGWAYAPTKEQAQTMSMGFCQKEGGKRCEVRVSACETNVKRDRTATARDVIGDAYRGFQTQTAQAPATRVPPPVSNDTSRATLNSPSVPIGQRNDPPPQQARPATPPATSPTVPPVAALELPKPPPTAPISGLPNDGTKRVALVIGNDRYESLPGLQKAVNDARSIGDTLSRLGFEVVKVENAPRRIMNQKLVEFTGKIGRGDTAFFFFAGHGVEIRGVNYLLPIDTPAARDNEEGLITGEGIPADQILERLQDRGAKVSLMVLDACRENPFKKAGSRGVGATRGLAQMTTPEGVFVLYSAGVGQTALDRLSDNDPNPNSVFTRAFINVLSKPDQSIQAMAKVTQQEVRKLAATVNHPQMPAYYDQILGQFTLAPAR
jgi:hypothetical protein